MDLFYVANSPGVISPLAIIPRLTEEHANAHGNPMTVE